jgi:hypothetical protein
MTPSGIEPATFRLVVQSLNQLRHRVTQLGWSNIRNIDGNDDDDDNYDAGDLERHAERACCREFLFIIPIFFSLLKSLHTCYISVLNKGKIL